MDWLGSDHMGTPTDTHTTIGEAVFSVLHGPCQKFIRHGKLLVAVEFLSFKRTVVWPEVVVEEELEVSL
jgi:hypothetical protein